MRAKTPALKINLLSRSTDAIKRTLALLRAEKRARKIVPEPTDPTAGWAWFVGECDERFDGPHPTRTAAIKHGLQEDYGLEVFPGGERLNAFHLVEARQNPIKLARYVDADRILESMCEQIDEQHGDEDGTGPTADAWTADQATDLERMIEATVAAWQAKHAIVVTPWQFTETRNAERVELIDGWHQIAPAMAAAE